MSDKTKLIIDKLSVLSMAVPGTKLNKQTMMWDQSLGLIRWYRGDSKDDIVYILKKICDDMQDVTSKDDIAMIKPYILKAFEGLDVICTTYSTNGPFVDTVTKLRRLLEEYLV